MIGIVSEGRVQPDWARCDNMELPPQAVAGGPRATDRFAAVTAAFVSGLAGTARAVEVTAFFLESVAARLEEAVRVGLT